jgi:hypothetical protein
MALGHTFYHKSIRKMVVIMGTLFNDINVRQFDSSGNEISRTKVPVAYGPKEKYLARIEAGGQYQDSAITLPRIAFELTNMQYDASRKTSSVQKLTHTDDNGATSYSYAPVPYNFDFSVFVYAKNAEDGTQILEQILPYFKPSFNVSVTEIPELNIQRDIPIQLNSVSYEDTYDGDFESRRAIVWTLDFTAQGNMYGAVQDGKLVTSATLGIYQEAEGDVPVTQLADSTTAPNPPTATLVDDFGYTTDISEGSDLF